VEIEFPVAVLRVKEVDPVCPGPDVSLCHYVRRGDITARAQTGKEPIHLIDELPAVKKQGLGYCSFLVAVVLNA
jgi:hypothetical protein